MPRFNPYKVFHGIHIPDAVMEMDLSPGAKLCYGVLAKMSGEKGVCWPSQEKLALRLKVGERQAMRYLDELESEQLIERQQLGLGRPNRYYFLDDRLISSPGEVSDQEMDQGQECHVRPDRDVTSVVTEESTPSYRTEKNHYEEEKEEKNHGFALSAPTATVSKNWLREYFDVFWEKGTWAKIAKGKAWEAWVKNIHSPDQAQVAINAAIRCGPLLIQEALASSRTVLHPATWLNQKRFEDDPAAIERNIACANGHSKPDARMQSIASVVQAAKERNGNV